MPAFMSLNKQKMYTDLSETMHSSYFHIFFCVQANNILVLKDISWDQNKEDDAGYYYVFFNLLLLMHV